MHQVLERLTGNKSRGKQATLAANVLTTKKKKTPERHAGAVGQRELGAVRGDGETQA